METKIESEVKEDPMFSFKNFFKPTTKNIQMGSLVVRGACVTLLANAVLIAPSNLMLACIIGGIAIVGGAIAEYVMLFTREKPIDTLIEASLDLKEEAKEETNKGEENVG